MELGDGMAGTWVEVDSENVPLRIGLTLTESALSNLPSFDCKMGLDFPDVAVDSLFKHILFDWVPGGHPPFSPCGRPHF